MFLFSFFKNCQNGFCSRQDRKKRSSVPSPSPEMENPNFVRGGFGRVSTNSNRARNNNNNSNSNRDSLPPLEGESYNLIEEAEVATSHVSGGGIF